MKELGIQENANENQFSLRVTSLLVNANQMRHSLNGSFPLICRDAF